MVVMRVNVSHNEFYSLMTTSQTYEDEFIFSYFFFFLIAFDGQSFQLPSLKSEKSARYF